MGKSKESSIKDLYDLKNKVAIVTGGYTGLGYDMACALAEAGCHIIITSRNVDKLDKTIKGISSRYGVDTLALSMDQSVSSQVKEMAVKAHEWKGHIDILINNAGGGSGTEGNFFKRPSEEVVKLITANLIGVLYCCKEVGRFMADQGCGKIINIGSIAGLVGRDRSIYKNNSKMEQPVDYAAAKAGVVGMTRD